MSALRQLSKRERYEFILSRLDIVHQELLRMKRVAKTPRERSAFQSSLAYVSAAQVEFEDVLKQQQAEGSP